MTIKTTISGGAEEPGRSTYPIGTGKKYPPRQWSTITDIDTSQAPWHESYGNGGKRGGSDYANTPNGTVFMDDPDLDKKR